jgi:hypothetical protein
MFRQGGGMQMQRNIHTILVGPGCPGTSGYETDF